MPRNPKFAFVPLIVAGLVSLASVLADEPPAPDAKKAEAATVKRVSLEVARDRAQLMHEVYESTLDMLHHRYFRSDTATVPARALEDVFADIQRRSETEARWISVNLPAMGVDHEPESEFEQQAAKKIAAGEKTVEVVAEGYYRRAGAIPLDAGCISCHSGFFRAQSTTSKFAALVISIPVTADASLAEAPAVPPAAAPTSSSADQ